MIACNLIGWKHKLGRNCSKLALICERLRYKIFTFYSLCTDKNLLSKLYQTFCTTSWTMWCCLDFSNFENIATLALFWFCWHICGLYPCPRGTLKWPFLCYKTKHLFLLFDILMIRIYFVSEDISCRCGHKILVWAKYGQNGCYLWVNMPYKAKSSHDVFRTVGYRYCFCLWFTFIVMILCIKCRLYWHCCFASCWTGKVLISKSIYKY